MIVQASYPVLMWLTDRLAPDFKTIADFRKDNGIAIRQVGMSRLLTTFTENSKFPLGRLQLYAIEW
jgi:hypothetical protein